jgi:hypothetical protein
MDFKQFKPQTGHPTKEQFTRIYFYDQGKCIAAPAIPEEVELARKHNPNAVIQKCFDEEAFKKANYQYNEHVKNLQGKFKDALMKEFHVPQDNFGHALYELASFRALDGADGTLEDIHHEFAQLSHLYSLASSNFKG